MVNVNAQVAPSVDFPCGEFPLILAVVSAGCWPFPASDGSDSGWKRRPHLPFSHGLNPGGVSEERRPLKRLLEPRPRAADEAFELRPSSVSLHNLPALLLLCY